MLDLTLILLQEKFAVCSLDNKMPIPMWVLNSRDFYSITKTHDELSIVSIEKSVPGDVKADKGWRALRIKGSLDFDISGVTSQLTTPLAEEKISVFVVATFETDYLFIKEKDCEKAVEVLSRVCNVEEKE